MRIERFYSVFADGLDVDEPFEQRLFAPTVNLRFRNVENDGLGEPLPRGTLRVFECYADTQLFAGEDEIRDVPIGLPVEIEIGRAADIRIEADWSTKVRDRRAGEALAREMQYRLVSTKLVSIALEIRQIGGHDVTNLRLTNASHRPRRDGDEFVFALDLEPGEERLSYRLSGRVPD